MAQTLAQKNKAARQDSLRELLSKQKHVEQVVKNIKKIEDLAIKRGEDGEVDYKEYQYSQYEVQRLAKATELRLKLVNKYLPDLKAIDIEGDIEHSGGLTITWQQ